MQRFFNIVALHIYIFMALQYFYSNKDFELETGVKLPGFKLAYTSFGSLNKTADNVVWVFHALTANSDVQEWWPGSIGEEKLFDPKRHYIICVNMPGSCYGSTGPLDVNSASGKPFFHQFPLVTTRDMIRMYQLLREHLGIKGIEIGIGGSMGGQQLLEWAIEEPLLFQNIFPVATNAVHSAWGRAFNASQRHAIEADSTWLQAHPDAGKNGMKVARGIALLSYRHYETYEFSQQENDQQKVTGFKTESYQRYQGEKLAKRFNAFSYYFLSKSMDAHNVARNRLAVIQALERIRAKTTVIGIPTDILFPVQEQELLAAHIPGAHLKLIQSKYGHDGFLLEFEQLQKIVSQHMGW